MKIVRPLYISSVGTLTSPCIYSSNITTPETGTTTYGGAVTYALNDKVTSQIYSATVTITQAKPAVITWTAHELVIGNAVSFTTTGAIPTGITASYTYFVQEILSANTFTVSITNGGAAMNTRSAGSGTHTCTVQINKVFESLQASNTGHTPRLASSAAWWQDMGVTNKYKMFDGSVTSQSKADLIEVTLTINSAVDTLVLLNISGIICQAIFTDTTSGVVHSQTYDLTLTGVTPEEYATDLLITGVTGFNSGTIYFNIYKGASPPSMCAIGACLVGLSSTPGTTLSGTTLGIQDFSVIEENEFGDIDVTPRTFSKHASFAVAVPNTSVDRFFRILTELRAGKNLFIGDTSITSTVIYGFPSDWSMTQTDQPTTTLNIDVKGLT